MKINRAEYKIKEIGRQDESMLHDFQNFSHFFQNLPLLLKIETNFHKIPLKR